MSMLPKSHVQPTISICERCVLGRQWGEWRRALFSPPLIIEWFHGAHGSHGWEAHGALVTWGRLGEIGISRSVPNSKFFHFALCILSTWENDRSFFAVIMNLNINVPMFELVHMFIFKFEGAISSSAHQVPSERSFNVVYRGDYFSICIPQKKIERDAPPVSHKFQWESHVKKR